MRKFLSVALGMILLVATTACNSSVAEVHPDPLKWDGTQGETWAVYWYLCGSDLESKNGMATADLYEMLAVDLPEEVQVVIQTGGANRWDNDFVDPEKSQRFVYGAGGLELVDEAPAQNMGSAQTLSEFLRFCSERYPADRQAVILWNHGGGSVAGVAFDEQFGYDSLTQQELYEAFGAACRPDPESPPFELVGFDACLMATIDTAYTFCDIARYMVASQELEPGIGWDYGAFLQALAGSPSMNGAELGRVICDSYAAGCDKGMVGGDITLSVISLGRIAPLVQAYNNMGIEALSYACRDAAFLGSLGRSASYAENYGGNTRDSGFTNMADLGDLARLSGDILPEYAGAVLERLEDCVVYRVNGPYRAQASGLSCYFPYDGEAGPLERYAHASATESQVYLYEYGVTGRLSQEGARFASTMQFADVPGQQSPLPEQSPALHEGQGIGAIPSLTELGLANYPLHRRDDGFARMELGPEIASYLSAVYVSLTFVDRDNDFMLHLGRDNNLTADWEQGIYQDNFHGLWGSLDGNLVYMDITYRGDHYNLYSVPILLNGEEYVLRVIYDFLTEEYSILGARRGMEGNGMTDRNLVQLIPGDRVTILLYATRLSWNEDRREQIHAGEVVVTPTTGFYDIAMRNGEFHLRFEMLDMRGDAVYSDAAVFEVENGDVSLYLN